MYQCSICQFEVFEGSGGWSSMHDNYTDWYNLEATIERKEILNYVEDMIKDMKESQWVTIDYNNINRITFCVYKRLQQLNKKVAKQFLKKYKIRISKGYKLALKDLEEEVEMAKYSLDKFKAEGI